MGMSYLDFENKHAGSTVWVLGSGVTLDHVDSSFLEDKVVVGTNTTGMLKNVEHYVVSNHWGPVQQGSDAGYWSVGSEVEQVPAQDRHPTKPEGERVLLVPTITQRYSDFTPARDWPDDRRTFVVGPTSLHFALHWALWIGAAHIVLIGADCGLIDEKNNADGYYEGTVDPAHQHHKLWQAKLEEMAAKIRSLGVSVHSLNPWVTFGLEGHRWTQR